MQFYTDSGLPSSVSTQDVSDPTSSSKISFDQYLIRSDRVVSFIEPAMLSIAMTKVFVIVTDTHETASALEFNLIEQSLMHSTLAAEKTKAEYWMINKFLALKYGPSVLRTDRFNMLYQEASNLFQLVVEFIDLSREKGFFKTRVAKHQSVAFDFGISVT